MPDPLQQEMPVDYYWNGRTDPAFNLALEEIMTAQADAPFVMLWRNRPTVVIGRNQNASVEFDSAYAREHGTASPVLASEYHNCKSIGESRRGCAARIGRQHLRTIHYFDKWQSTAPRDTLSK